MASSDRYRRYRAPAEEGAALVDPSWSAQLEQLARGAGPPDITIGGAPLGELAVAGRRALLADALRHTRRYADADAPEDGPFVVSGHQPELFHPGVWFKNFALDALARRSSGVGVHLLIDSDLCRDASVRTPTGSVADPWLQAVSYDRPHEATPYEERRLTDAAMFESFDARVRDALTPLVPNPLVERLWTFARSTHERTDALRDLLSEPRHTIERAAGSQTLEAPLSAVCDAESFHRFAAELVTRADDTHAAYNGALAEYRTAHRLTNAAQPLPDLTAHDGWVETPLWVWSEASPRRHALFVRRDDGGITLGDDAGWQAPGPADLDGVVSLLADLRRAGIKVRSRALVTTLYCRLVLADLFLHGIGGAKYDQVTDRFGQRLFGVSPPPHATLSATLRLPIDHGSPTDDDRRDALRRLRDLRYHPERFVEGGDHAEQKRCWVATPKTPANAAERHAVITAANHAMAESLAAERATTEERLKAIEKGLRASTVLDSREHSFCLFPADYLGERLAALCRLP